MKTGIPCIWQCADQENQKIGICNRLSNKKKSRMNETLSNGSGGRDRTYDQLINSFFSLGWPVSAHYHAESGRLIS